GDGHASDGDAAFGRQRQIAGQRGRGIHRGFALFRERGMTTTMADSDVVRIENLNKRFGDLVAVNDASLGVREGEIHALVGENGAGKTTLMNVLYGLLARDSGSIHFRGRPVEFAGPA